MHFLHRVNHSWRRLVVFPIRVYQKYVSPDHSFWAKAKYPFGYCKYTPTCSEYAVQAIHKHGVLFGITRGVWRIIRCNPWSRGGNDFP